MNYLKPNIDAIPAELKAYPQWVNWKAEIRDGKPTKPPYIPHGRSASHSDSHTWSTFEACQKALSKFDGLGFVLTKDDPYVGIDLDKSRCPAFNLIHPEAEKIVKEFNSYSEISPSGRGIRIFVKGTIPRGRKKGNYEIYKDVRFLTLTGHTLNEYKIEERQSVIDEFYQTYFSEKKEEPGPQKEKPTSPLVCLQERLQKALNSKHGTEIKRLYDVDISSYPSQSEADLALCAHLAFWLNGDVASIDAAFRESKLMRKKWDEKHGEQTYGEMTIEKALNGCREFYQESEKIQNTDERKSIPKKSKLLSLDDLDERFSQNVRWIYKKHIPCGMPIIVNAREGTGKTTICIQIADEIIQNHHEGIIIWIASEGFVQDTKDKMDRLHVDRNRLLLLQHNDGTFQFNFSLPQDRKQLDDSISGQKVLAVFIDSIRGISPFDDSDSKIKNVMSSLNSIVCDKYGSALIYIDHHKKGSAETILDRSVGTTAKTAAVRRVFSVIPVSQYVRKITLAKNNIMGEIPSDLMAALSEDKLFIYEAHDKSESSVIGQAEQWLIGMFNKSERYKATEIYDIGKVYGFTSDVLKKAKANLNIGSQNEGGIGKPWFWTCNTFLNP